MSIARAAPAPSVPAPSRPARSALLLFILWTGIGLSFATQFYLSSTRTGNPISWSEALSYALADWYVWAVLSLVTLYLSKRFPIERLQWSNHLLIHLIASATIALAYTFIRAAVAQAQSWLIGDYAAFADVVQPLLFKTYHFNFLVYWVILAIAHAINYYRRFHERERTAVELERRLAEARLQALQMQLNPHFLFNAMHSISALMHQDIDAADSMLARLSELLRLTLKNDSSQTIPLSEELQMLERYLDIERIRFGDRLSIELQIEPHALPAHVPCLLLQPIVENALKHGIAPYAKPGELRVTAQLQNDRLVLAVEDNGGGLTRPMKEGIGLSNTKSRLEQLYGTGHLFDFAPRDEGGVRVRIEIPAQLPSPPAP